MPRTRPLHNVYLGNLYPQISPTSLEDSSPCGGLLQVSRGGWGKVPQKSPQNTVQKAGRHKNQRKSASTKSSMLLVKIAQLFELRFFQRIQNGVDQAITAILVSHINSSSFTRSRAKTNSSGSSIEYRIRCMYGTHTFFHC